MLAQTANSIGQLENKDKDKIESQAFSEIMTRLRRSARNSARLHLEQHHVQALIESPLYTMLASLESRELTEQWNESNLASTGLPGGKIEKSGLSAGMTMKPTAANDSPSASAITMAALRLSKRSNN